MPDDRIKSDSGETRFRRMPPDLGELPEEPPPPRREKDSLFAGMPRYGGIAKVEEALQCDGCQQLLRKTRSYTLLNLVFVWVFVYVNLEDFMMCPRCMRRHILLWLPLAILLANLLSPIVAIWWLVTFVRTFFSQPE